MGGVGILKPRQLEDCQEQFHLERSPNSIAEINRGLKGLLSTFDMVWHGCWESFKRLLTCLYYGVATLQVNKLSWLTQKMHRKLLLSTTPIWKGPLASSVPHKAPGRNQDLFAQQDLLISVMELAQLQLAKNLPYHCCID
jgi:hypothetical protein